ncbi:MAG TPA: serine/threonine-protein kinase [Vicinamibacterales bacterium]|nr:serine/threonine-protein kinase [Vicinamibacterales bacterium]
MPIWARCVVTAAALRVACAIAFYLAGIYNVDVAAPLPVAAYAVLMITLSGLGLLLVVTNQRDVRAAWLGGVLLLLAVPLTSRFLSQTAFAIGTFLARVQAGAFLPAFLWRFASEFPSRLDGRLGRFARAAAAIAAWFGGVAFAVNLSIAIWPLDAPLFAWREWLATGKVPASVYWPLLFLLSAGAALALLFRMVRTAGDDRLRVRIFVSGLVLGLMPLFVEITLEELWPAYEVFVHRPAVESWVAVMVFVPLALIPFVTAYSVLYDRIVDTRLVIRAAIQHALAKYTIAAATVLPFAALAAYLVAHRAEPIATLLSGPRPLVLAAAVTAGIASLRFRKRILHAIDRRFFREVYDASLLVTRLVVDGFIAGSGVELARRLRSEIDRTLHARADLFVLDDGGGLLEDPEGSRPPLEVRSVLLSLAAADAYPMDIGLRGDTPLTRLPESERRWIQAGEYELILATRSRQGELMGILALARKRSGLPFSEIDRRSLGALAAPLGLVLENDRLRRLPDSATAPAAECPQCRQLHAPGESRCTCGGALEEAAVPHVLRGVYRFERRVGAGGMGIVYRATDLNLNRHVAIKTLPRVTPARAEELKREAQAMASQNHVNLATIYGIESWRGTPFLIEEFMPGGTLADRLHGGPLPVAEAVQLACELCDVLAQLHRAGIVHCDIKPSNVGFSQAGVAKLLDFGIAYLLRDAAVAPTRTDHGEDAPDFSMIVTHRGIVGTAAYMSPEAAMGSAPNPQFDLWSLAILLFEAVGGQRPFAGQTSSDVLRAVLDGPPPDLMAMRADCPPDLARFLASALAADPRQRPATAAVMKGQVLALRIPLA